MNNPTRLSWRRLAGLDFHVLATLMLRGWGVLGGVLTLIFLPLGLTAAQQGYYYTFASILALQIFFELGLNQIVVQLVSHEVAHLQQDSQGRWRGDEQRLMRLADLVQFLRRWYRVAALIFALLCGLAGVIFFGRQGGEGHWREWAPPWFGLVALTAMNLWLSPRLAVLEGFGQVGHVARMRLVQTMTGHAFLWCGLWLGAGLWVALAQPFLGALFTYYWLKQSVTWRQFVVPRVGPTSEPFNWRTDVFPLQWRIALSWVSGYFIFYMFTPLVFAYQGAAEAGRLGMALAIFSAASTVGMSWVNAKAPSLTMHIARSERTSLNALFKGVLWRSTAVTASLCTLVVAAALFLRHLDLPLINRLASVEVLAVLALATVVNGVIYAMAVYMRAHREEPMLVQSIAVGLLVAILNVAFADRGTFPMVSAYTVVVVAVALPWTVKIWRSYARRGTL